jgi:type III pantothenate kinase
MNLIIDIGNTQVKIAVFNHRELIFKDTFVKEYLIPSLQKIETDFSVKNAILSSVGSLNKDDLHEIEQMFPLVVLDHQTKIPFFNKYKTPSTLGVDRIALIAGAVTEYPGKNVLVIDAGSCVTYDFVDAGKNYYGGAISPGIEMRYRSLNTFTANLPKLSRIDKIPQTGNSTDNAIHSGVLNGIKLEIEGVIEQYSKENRNFTIVLTGGDTIFLAKNIKSTIFANPNFLLVGLNSILIYNIDE